MSAVPSDTAKLVERALTEIRAGRSTFVPFTPEKYPGATVVVNLLAAEALADAVERLTARIASLEWAFDERVKMQAKAETDRDRLAALLTDACDVAIWLSGLPCLNPSEDEAWETWVTKLIEAGA